MQEGNGVILKNFRKLVHSRCKPYQEEKQGNAQRKRKDREGFYTETKEKKERERAKDVPYIYVFFIQLGQLPISKMRDCGVI